MIVAKSSMTKKNNLLIGVLFSITIIYISIINFSSLFLFSFFLIFALIIGKLFFKTAESKRITIAFLFYTIMAMVIYTLQYISLPDYIFRGLSGPPGGIGTDDSKYFYEAITGENVRPNLEPRPNGEVYFYSMTLLNSLADIIKLFKTVHPLDLILFNVLGLSFTPIFTSKVAQYLTNNNKVSRLVFTLTLVCPILMVNGLILIRDGWTAVLFIGAIYFLLQKRFILLILTCLFLYQIRVGSAALLILLLVIIGVYLFKEYKTSLEKKGLVFILSTLVLIPIFGAIIPILLDYFYLKGFSFSNFFRSQFVEGFMTRSVEESGEPSIFYTINQQPPLIRVPLAFLYFFGAPFLSLGFYNDGVFIPRYFIQQAFSVLFLIFYVRYFINGLHYSWKFNEKKILLLIILFAISVLILSQMSLQFRHKTMIMPLFYILVAYGYYNHTRLGNQIGIIAASILLVVEMIVLFI